EGLLNLALTSLGIIDDPLTIMNTTTAVCIGIVYSYLPFMILPLYASLEKIKPSLIESAEDLGCPSWEACWQGTFPVSVPGCWGTVLIGGGGEFVMAGLVGGSDTLMIGETLWTEFFNNRDWPVSSAVAVILLMVLVVPIVLFQRQQQRAQEAGQ